MSAITVVMHEKHSRTLTTSTKCHINTGNKVSDPWLQSLTTVKYLCNTELSDHNSDQLRQ